jgi:phage terminase large subunit-like protein
MDNELIDQLTPEQVDLLLEQYGEDGLRKIALVEMARLYDTPESFAAYFELMHGIPLHSEGKKWVRNAYEAHEQGRGLAQECHREAGKTTVFSKFFLSYRIGKEPWKANIVIRINDTKSNDTTAGVARIIEHDPSWKLVFPNIVPDKNRGWGAEGYNVRDTDIEDEEWNRLLTTTPDEPTFVGRGWKSGAIIGSRFNGVVIVDDIHDEDNTSSDRQLKAVLKWYTDTFGFCNMAGNWEIWNFTPWTSNDVYAYIKSTGEYLHSKSPLMTPAKEGDEGALYWPPMPVNLDYPELGTIQLSGRWWHVYNPELWPFERIASMYRKYKALGFARMMFLDLEATKGLTLKKEWLHYFPAEEIDISWPVYVGVDYASTADRMKAKDHDFASISLFRSLPRGGLVLFDGWRGRVSKGECLVKVQSLSSVYPTIRVIGVETHGKGEDFYSDLALLDDVFGYPLPLMPITHGRTSKGYRFEEKLGPWFQFGRIWISSYITPWLENFINTWLSYPQVEFDDDLDAVYMGAVAGEGAMPSKSSKSERRLDKNAGKIKSDNPYTLLANA